jgi:hypothetical protein
MRADRPEKFHDVLPRFKIRLGMVCNIVVGWLHENHSALLPNFWSFFARLYIDSPPVCLFVSSNIDMRSLRSNQHDKTGERRRLHKENQGILIRPAIHNGIGRSPAGIFQGTHAVEVSRIDARTAGGTVLQRRHQPILRGVGKGIASRKVLEARP